MDEKRIKEILEIICCPHCSGELKFENEQLICKNCKRIYKIKDEIIVLL